MLKHYMPVSVYYKVGKNIAYNLDFDKGEDLRFTPKFKSRKCIEK